MSFHSLISAASPIADLIKYISSSQSCTLNSIKNNIVSAAEELHYSTLNLQQTKINILLDFEQYICEIDGILSESNNQCKCFQNDKTKYESIIFNDYTKSYPLQGLGLSVICEVCTLERKIVLNSINIFNLPENIIIELNPYLDPCANCHYHAKKWGKLKIGKKYYCVPCIKRRGLDLINLIAFNIHETKNEFYDISIFTKVMGKQYDHIKSLMYLSFIRTVCTICGSLYDLESYIEYAYLLGTQFVLNVRENNNIKILFTFL